MQIEEKLLFSAGATEKTFNPGEMVFREGDPPYFYCQIISGEVKLNNYKEDGKEFIQNIISQGQSFGEVALMVNKPYPTNAIALHKCRVILLRKTKFYHLLTEYPEISISLNQCISERLYFKFVMLKNNSSQSPIVRLKGLMDYLKSFQKDSSPFSYKIGLTRQQMASLTGLTVETAIRAIKTMERNQLVKIKERKVYY